MYNIIDILMLQIYYTSPRISQIFDIFNTAIDDFEDLLIDLNTAFGQNQNNYNYIRHELDINPLLKKTFKHYTKNAIDFST